MSDYYCLNDSILGEKIYCVFERSSKARILSTQGRHNAQAVTIDGNPAVATIVKTLRYIKQ